MKTVRLILLICLFADTADLNAQLKDSSAFNISAEIVSSYVWRGSLATGNLTPNIQPTLFFNKRFIEIGIFGSTDLKGDYKEIDPYISFFLKSFKITFTDYNWNFAKANYFNYKNDETGHMLEGSLSFTGPESFPLSISWNTMFYGFDKTHSGDTTRQAYSTYFELAYTKGNVNLFCGFSPWESYYTNYNEGFKAVNIGMSYIKPVKITGNFSLPLKASLIINPSGGYTKNDYVHLVLGVKF